MSKVISFPNQLPDDLKLCLHAVKILEKAFEQIRDLIEGCPDTTAKMLLMAQQHMLQIALDEAQKLVANIVAKISNERASYRSRDTGQLVRSTTNS